MKIGDAKITPLPPIVWGENDERDVALLELTSLEGIAGLGSAYTTVELLQDALARFQQGDIESQLNSAETISPMSAIDIALWDIRGKEKNLSVSELLGGRRHDRVLAYATLDLPFTSAIAGDAFDRTLRSVVDQGFKAIKIGIENFGHRDSSRNNSEWDHCEASLLRFARHIVGKDIQLMLDVYASDPRWTADLDWALKTIRVLEELDYLWIEEPLPPGAIDDFVRLARMSGIAVAGGESFILPQDFKNISNRNALDILQPDCTMVGGLTQMLSIRNIASQNNISVIPHGWNTAIGLAADLQFQSTVTDDRLCLVEVRPHPSITDTLKDSPFALDSEGKITVPKGPGLGIELIDDFKKRIGTGQ